MANGMKQRMQDLSLLQFAEVLNETSKMVSNEGVALMLSDSMHRLLRLRAVLLPMLEQLEPLLNSDAFEAYPYEADMLRKLISDLDEEKLI